MSQLEWRPLSPFGARVDLDLAADVTDATVEQLRELLDQRSLLVFSDQRMSGADHKRVAGWFGVVPGDKDPNFVSTDPEVGRLGSGPLSFHSDQTSSPQPLVALTLHAVDVTDGAASTIFVDAVQAAASMPPSLRARVSELDALHVLPMSTAERQRFADIPEDRPAAAHPVLLTHPRTGVPVLFVNTRTDRIVGLEPDESETLLQELFDHLYQRADRYEHRWTNGDFLVWDNIAMQHGRAPIPSGARRTLRRVAVGTADYVDAVPRELITAYDQS